MKLVLNLPKIPARHYGEHVVLVNLMKALIERAPADWQISTHTIGPRRLDEHRANMERIDSAHRLSQRHTPVPYTLLEPLLRAGCLPAELLYGEHDVVHSFSGLVPKTKNLIVTIHDVIFMRLPEREQTPEWVSDTRARLQRLAAQAKFVHTVSEYSKGELVQWLGVAPEKVVVITNGVDHSIYKPIEDWEMPEATAVLRRFGINRPYLLHMGGNAKRKNLTRLVQAYHLLRKKHGANHALVVVGSKFTPELERAAGEFKQDVHCLGYVDRTDAVDILKRAQLLVCPSLYEGFGLPPLEAMACGVPTALSMATSLPEVGADAAVYFNPLDIEDMAEVMSKALSDDVLRKSMVASGIKRSKQFSWSQTTNQFITLYQDLASKKSDSLITQRVN